MRAATDPRQTTRRRVTRRDFLQRVAVTSAGMTALAVGAGRRRASAASPYPDWIPASLKPPRRGGVLTRASAWDPPVIDPRLTQSVGLFQFAGLVSNRLLSNIFTAFHDKLQKVSFGRKRIVNFLERFDTVWLRLSSKVASGALGYGKTIHAQRVLCGHTHEAMQVKRDGVEYFNSGSWTQQRATYITIDSTGVTIHDYEERIDDNYSGEERSETDSEFAELSHSSGLSADLEYENIPG